MSTLHVSKFGEINPAPVLVLLHGWGSSSKIWQTCIAELSKDFQVWCIDLPGHGQSQSINWNSSIEQGLNLLANTIPRVSSIIGWSLGGLFAQVFLHHYPKRARNLMLIASTPKFIASEDWPNGMAQETFYKFSQHFTDAPEETLKQFHLLQTLHGLKAKNITQMLEQSSSRQALQRILWGLQWLETIDLRNSNIAKNVCIQMLQGENDQVSSIHAAIDTAQLWSNMSLHKIANAGHVPFLSHPKLFIKRVQSMMKAK